MRKVHCRKYKEELDGLQIPPFPGPLGEDIFQNVSSRAWKAWQRHQTMLINEKHLNTRDLQTRRFLQEQMKLFFSGEDYEKVAGYVPPEQEEQQREAKDQDKE